VADETEKQLRAELAAALEANTSQLKRDLRAALAELREMDDPLLPLQFEADCYWGIACCATEEPVFDSECLDESLPADWAERRMRPASTGIGCGRARSAPGLPLVGQTWAVRPDTARRSCSCTTTANSSTI
jgi:hypothetical protein